MKRKNSALLKLTALVFMGLLTCYCSNQVPLLHSEKGNFLICKINGKPWKADATLSEKNLRLVLYRDKTLQVHGKAVMGDQGEKVKSTVSFFITSVDAPGIYPLGLNPKNSADYSNFEASPCSFYFTDQGFTGFVNITKLDTLNRVIAGTFEYKALASGPSFHSVQVTDGLFNMTY